MRGTLPANKTSRRSKTVNLCPSAEQRTPDWHGLVRGTNSSKSQRAVWEGALIAIAGRKEATVSQDERCTDDVPHPRAIGESFTVAVCRRNLSSNLWLVMRRGQRPH